MYFVILTEVVRIGHPLLGILIPGGVLLLSVVLTWVLYRKFSKD